MARRNRPTNRSKFPNKGKTNGASNRRNRTDSNYRQNKDGKDKPYENGSSNSAGTYKDTSLNDISWYARYPELLAAAASIPFPYKPGMTLVQPFNIVADSTHTFTAKYAMPGVMALDWAPSFGISNNATDPASIAVKELYSRVRSSFSGSLDADPPDFLMYIGALDSIFSYIGHLKRIYRILTTYTPQNYDLPDRLLSALGVPNNVAVYLRSNRTRFWGVINNLVHSSRKFTIPDQMDLLRRHYWMNDNVYCDADTLNSQMYVFTQKYWYQYTELNTPDGVAAAGLNYVQINFNAAGITDFVEYLSEFGLSLINALAGWDDSYTISGYLQRAFDGANQFVVDLLAQEEAFTPVYQPEVLMQIENSTTLPAGQEFPSIENPISQDPKTNSIISNPLARYTGAAAQVINEQLTQLSPMVSLRSATPNAADVVIATRLKAFVTPLQGTAPNKFSYVHAGTEIPIGWRVWSQNVNGRVVTGVMINIATSAAPTWAADSSNIYALWHMSCFDWHPIVPVFLYGGSNVVMQYVGDLHNATTLSQSQLREIHRVCLLSEFSAFSF